MRISPAINPTDDGSDTLLHPIVGEAYHSTQGAVGEAMHVFIGNGLHECELQNIRILEVGFGSGLNAWLTLSECRNTNISVDYLALELYPIEVTTAEKLNYSDDPLFLTLHTATWDEFCEVIPQFRLKKIEADLVDVKFDTTFDLVYFDAFAPQSQPELWSEQVFANIFAHMNRGAALVTYCCKGDVKRALRSVGFEVKRLKGALGKRHMIRAIKN